MIAFRLNLIVDLLLLLAGGAALGVGYRLVNEARAADNQPGAKIRKPGFDLYGDPLPPGALARLGSVRFRYPTPWCRALAFSPDGKLLAGAGNAGIQLWESGSGRPVRFLDGRADSVTFLDGGRRVAGGRDTFIVWDVADGKEVRRLEIKGGFRLTAYSANARLLAGAGNDGVVRLLDPVTGAVLKLLRGHQDQVNKPPVAARNLSLAFSPDGKALASACFEDTRVLVWDVATGQVRHTLPGHRRPSAVAFSLDGRILAVGGDQIIHFWDVATGGNLRELRGHVGGIYGLAFSPDGSTLASATTGHPFGRQEDLTTDRTVRLWNLRTGEGRTLPGPKQCAWTVAFSPDGKTLAMSGTGRFIHRIDLTTAKKLQLPASHDGAIFHIALSPDGSTLASGGQDMVIRVWDLKASRERGHLEGHQDIIQGLAFRPDGRELVSCSDDNTARVWDWREGKEVRRLTQQPGAWHYGKIGDIKRHALFSPDGKKVASQEGVLDGATGKKIWSFTGHSGVHCAAFSPDGRFVASGELDGMAFLWDAATGKLLRVLQGHQNPIIAIAFSPDGRTVATGSGSLWNSKEQTVRLWEVTTGLERRRFVGHQAQVTSIVFSRDGATIISGSEDGTALVWDASGVLKPELVKEDDEAQWQALASADAVTAYEAVCALAAHKNIAFLARHLRPVEAPDPATIERLVADLDSKQFAARQRAERELTKLAELAEPELRRAAVEGKSPELRRRAAMLAGKLDTSPPSAGAIQALRAIEVLERVATPEARQLLQKLAGGAPQSRLTGEAKAAPARLASH